MGKIEDVWDELQVIKGKIDEVLAKDNIITNCHSCNGIGTITRSVDHGQDGMGPDTESTPCHHCDGTGKINFGVLNA
jgi:DnaJ-class molecular chaperone